MTFEPIWGAIIAWYLFLAGLGGGAFAVSYTHLDVYKRQDQSGPPESQTKDKRPERREAMCRSLESVAGLVLLGACWSRCCCRACAQPYTPSPCLVRSRRGRVLHSPRFILKEGMADARRGSSYHLSLIHI